jgi:hypothetical protein
MTESSHSRIWVAVVAGIAVFALATWVGRDEPQDGADPLLAESVTEARSSVGLDSVDGALRIAEHGRLSLDAAALPDEGPLTLVLDLPDEARSDAFQTIRIVSTDGRRIDTTATPLAGSGTGVRLEIDSDFLSRGRYLIEVDTAEKTPLKIRRYVLELN